MKGPYRLEGPGEPADPQKPPKGLHSIKWGNGNVLPYQLDWDDEHWVSRFEYEPMPVTVWLHDDDGGPR